MKITKLGHCCLLIEEKGVRILTDPGTYSTLQNDVKNINLILITHEHTDHIHMDSLKIVLHNNQNAKIITNNGVAKLLDKENIKYELLLNNQHTKFNDILIEGFGEEHALMYQGIPNVENTGYFIDNKLFYPGDALTNPNKHVEVLALPVAGPWLTIKDAIDYARDVKPKICFPVHDGMFKKEGGVAHILPPKILTPLNIEFVVIAEGASKEF